MKILSSLLSISLFSSLAFLLLPHPRPATATATATPVHQNTSHSHTAADAAAFARVMCQIKAKSSNSSTAAGANADYVVSSCKTTQSTANLCTSLLIPFAEDVSGNPATLACVAMALSASTVRAIKANITQIRKKADAKTDAALNDCSTTFNSAEGAIKKSAKMTILLLSQATKGKKLNSTISNVRTLMSAALTDENTCMEGFGEVAPKTDKRRATLKKIVGNAVGQTQIALAIFELYARKLLST
ncbi:pectinesterase inhibitor 9-like [Malania oleifera]|uniref:pectinesterase inhibitor 9-like n=1 Tax=Malania oleifera TaxID=397392 RepID=UPI0025ADFB6A|nr:pectinesterase inhibitor 9-like [Malania oleifera]